MLTPVRLAWQMQRWELLVLLGGSLLLALAIGILTWQLEVSRGALEACYAQIASAGTPACGSSVGWGNFLSSAVGTLAAAATAAPFLVGVLLGAPLVSREIEKRTAPMAWSLSRSRRRWLVGRVVPVAVAVALVLLAVGFGADALLRTTREVEPGFLDLGMHGPLIAVRGLAVLGIGVLVGLLIGRVLPAILITGLVTIALFVGLQLVRDQMMRAEATWVPVDRDGSFMGMVYDQAWTDDATGELVTYDEAIERYPEVFGPTGSFMPPSMTQVYLTTPPELYPVFVAREAAALGGVAVIVSTVALCAVSWRRPE